MEEWIKQVFTASEFGILVLPAGFLLGLITAFGSFFCSAPMMAGIVGYAGSRNDLHRRDVLVAVAFFMLGTIVSLSAMGFLVGYFGQAAESSLGIYGKILIGIVIILFGFAALDILPFKLPTPRFFGGKFPNGLLGASVFGLAIGGASTTCIMACCGPAMLPIVLGLSALSGQGTWGAAILATFAVGFSLPMAATMLGIGMGKLSGIANRIARPTRIASGILLLVAGFWLIFTF